MCKQLNVMCSITTVRKMLQENKTRSNASFLMRSKIKQAELQANCCTRQRTAELSVGSEHKKEKFMVFGMTDGCLCWDGWKMEWQGW